MEAPAGATSLAKLEVGGVDPTKPLPFGYANEFTVIFSDVHNCESGRSVESKEIISGPFKWCVLFQSLFSSHDMLTSGLLHHFREELTPLILFSMDLQASVAVPARSGRRRRFSRLRVFEPHRVLSSTYLVPHVYPRPSRRRSYRSRYVKLDLVEPPR